MSRIHTMMTLLAVAASTALGTGRLENEVLPVDGRPFFPIGAWGRTPE